MKLWLLRPIENCPNNPWEPWYDKNFGFVVRAETEREAREIAAKKAGDEGENAWSSVLFSTCDELTTEGPAGVVIHDYASA